ncbi:MAG: OpgC domain-containing protein [Alphaproteobacteria bacterium]
MSAGVISAHAAQGGGRDLRLDFFRGLALIFIFLNHIPGNAMSWLSSRNFGFSDATEIFIFISGYSVILAYGGVIDRQGFLPLTARIWRRAWQVYAAHIFLFVVFVAHISYVSERFNPAFAEEMNIGEIFEAPHTLMFQALILAFKPANMDVLPLYIVLLAVFPPVIVLLKRQPAWVLAGSFLLWLAVQYRHWNLPAYPDGAWFFNPFAWQLLFIVGGWCALRRDAAPWRRIPPRLGLGLSLAYLLFALAIVATWTYSPWAVYVPVWLRQILYPIDKTELDVLRLLHFLALAYVVVVVVRPGAAFLGSWAARPFIICGRHSLQIFCTGVFLSFLGHFILSEVNSSLGMQVGVSLAGIALLVGLAATISWYDRASGKRGGGSRTAGSVTS